jgi:hypothetical protein
MIMIVIGLIILAQSNLDKMLPQIQKELAERNAK